MEEENVCAQLYVNLYLKHHDGSIKLSALTTIIIVVHRRREYYKYFFILLVLVLELARDTIIFLLLKNFIVFQVFPSGFHRS